MLTKENDIKIADFGISRILNLETINLTPMAGSFDYQSPEIKKGSNYDFKTDIWYVYLHVKIRNYNRLAKL